MATESMIRPGNSAERVFYLLMVAVITAAVFLGFAQSFFLRPLFPHVVAAREPLFYVHGAIFVAWIVLLAVQASLIVGGSTATHRRLGGVGIVMVPAMLGIGVYAALIGARRPTGFTGVPDPPLHFLGVLIAWVLMFSLFAGFALVWRRDPPTHKRLMLLAAITLAEAGVTRWPFPFLTNATSEMTPFWVTCLFLAPLAAWDVVAMRRLHPATLWGGFAFIAYGPLRDAAASTHAWQAVGRWAMGLLG